MRQGLTLASANTLHGTHSQEHTLSHTLSGQFKVIYQSTAHETGSLPGLVAGDFCVEFVFSPCGFSPGARFPPIRCPGGVVRRQS